MSKTLPEMSREPHPTWIVGKSPSQEQYYHWGRALGKLAPENSVFVVACDHRFESDNFKQSLVLGLSAEGIGVVDIGKKPNDLAAFAGDRLNTEGIAIVTGGTHPPEVNGLRWRLQNSSQSCHEQMAFLKKSAAEADTKTKMPQAGTYRFWDPSQEWIHWLQQVWYDTPSVPLKVVLDTVHGSWSQLAGLALHEVFPDFTVEILHDTPEKSFSVEASQAVAALGSQVPDRHADLGIVLESDDLFHLLDDRGQPLSRNEIGWLFLQMLGPALENEVFLHGKHCCPELIAEVRRYGGRPLCISGKKLDFVGEMRRTGALIGFGSGGGIYFRGARGNRIVVFALCWILDYLAYLHCPLSIWRTQCPEDLLH